MNRIKEFFLLNHLSRDSEDVPLETFLLLSSKSQRKLKSILNFMFNLGLIILEMSSSLLMSVV